MHERTMRPKAQGEGARDGTRRTGRMVDGATDALEGDGWREEGTGKRGSAWVLRAVTWRACSRKRRTGSVRGRARGERRRGRAKERGRGWKGGVRTKKLRRCDRSACSRQCREGPGEGRGVE